ncbi:hypothetical protein TSUD_287700 [Trifolium subterraneum]|uniref:Uncharacterized protein n=1 Tax=Trifolium subterraneum TaxID=3900 RepID=A0A2Z6NFL7_TRISU|nr:hypothetical protein TSUD_287700 [Trifolium subterraneum]
MSHGKAWRFAHPLAGRGTNFLKAVGSRNATATGKGVVLYLRGGTRTELLSGTGVLVLSEDSVRGSSSTCYEAPG